MIGLRYTRKSRDGLRLISVAALFGLAGICHAQSPAKVQDTGVDANPPSITTCVACHGALGAGTVSGGPRLAGNDPDYLAHALAMFKAGTRASDAMQAVARNLSDSDIHKSGDVLFTAESTACRGSRSTVAEPGDRRKATRRDGCWTRRSGLLQLSRGGWQRQRRALSRHRRRAGGVCRRPVTRISGTREGENAGARIDDGGRGDAERHAD